MARKKSNLLKMTDVKKKYKELDTIETYTFDDGKELKFSPFFKVSVIEELLRELAEKMNYAHEKGIEINDAFILHYINFLCIKYFTHLKDSISDEFEKQLQEMEWLIDTGYYAKIINEVFLPQELHKVMDAATDINSRAIFFEKLEKDLQRKLEKLDIFRMQILSKFEDNADKESVE